MLRQPANDGGFTLVELVLAITLSAFLLWAAHSLVSTGLLADRLGGEGFDRTQTLRILSDGFRADIEGAANESSYTDWRFTGDATSIKFCTSRPQAPGNGGGTAIVAVEYTFDEDSGTLYRREKSLFDTSLAETTSKDGEAEPQGKPFRVSVRFSYLSGTEWSEDWDNDSLPDAVRMEAASPPGPGKGRDCIVLAMPAVH